MDINKDTTDFLLSNLEKLHTTEMGIARIKKNLSINVNDVVNYCKEQIEKPGTIIYRKGKNYYASVDNCTITINAHSYTIITAHIIKLKRQK